MDPPSVNLGIKPEPKAVKKAEPEASLTASTIGPSNCSLREEDTNSFDWSRWERHRQRSNQFRLSGVGIQAIKEIESGIGKEAGGSHAETGEAIDSYHPTIV